MRPPTAGTTARPARRADGDQALVARSLEGDSAAFRQLVLRHRRIIDAACSAVSSSIEHREDAVQRAIVDIWKGLPSFRGESQVSTWMYRVARNAALRHSRSEAKRETDLLDDDFDMVATQDDWEAASATKEIVQRALASLPDDQRQALLLHCQAGLSMREIASTLVAAEGTVKAWIHRARAEIQRQLDEKGD